MLLKITQKCDMGCKHCLSNCISQGKNMPIELVEDSIEWADNHGIRCIIISGGEPFMHPKLFDILSMTEKYQPTMKFAVTTNGEWLYQNKRQAKKLFNGHQNIVYQITNDPRWYPRLINLDDVLFRNRSNVYCTKEIDYIYPQGRALAFHDLEVLSARGKCAKCTNMNLVMIQLYRNQNLTLENLFKEYENLNRSCSPQIQVDGSISFGESDLCGNIGNIYMDDETILDNAFNHPCEKCRDIMNQYNKLFIGKTELDHIKIAMGLGEVSDLEIH